GDLELGGVHLSDAKGDEVVALETLRVAPAWGDLVRGAIAIDRIDVHGVRLHVVKDANGVTNLATLFKPRPPPTKPSQPSHERIELRKLAVDDVVVTVDQPDGSRIRVSDVVVDASMAAVPADKTVALEVGKLGVSVAIDKGDGTLKVGVKE